MVHQPRTWGRKSTERGAAVVEYALGLAVVAVLLISGFEKVSSATEGDLRAKQNAGSPDLSETYAQVATTVTTTTITAEATTTTTPYTVTVSLSGSAVEQGSSRWIASVVITVVNTATGAYVSQAAVSGIWVGGSGGTASCITNVNGTCPVTLTKLQNATPSVTFTVSGVTVDGSTGSTLPGTITIGAPT